ncbi:phage tail protein I [Pseudomonas citronellolis]|uniref:phage tail protein I n=1 Tax=Pseudomonas citronellolis TaxID=53408 RepID=UPI002D77C778|nr:phage tail protein I [Pseudomonas citronellolis]WRT86051.1 phage tail protein I [Pseudomonas citronellolis]
MLCLTRHRRPTATDSASSSVAQMSSRLLPLNATAMERTLADVMSRDLAVRTRDLMNPDTCPVEFLPYLAWAYSVDRWSSDWPAETKRKAIKDAYYVHAHKGTIGALRRVVEPLGYALEVSEWWQQTPEGTPGTFSIGIDQGYKPMLDEVQRELERLIDDAKPVSRQFDYITISGSLLGPNGIAAAVSSSDAADLIYPKRYVTDLAPRERPLGRLYALMNETMPEAINGE